MLFALTLAALVKLLIASESPRLCAGLYTAFVSAIVVLGILAGSTTIGEAALSVLLAFAISFSYFWVLNRLELMSGLWWIVLLGGAAAAFFL